MEISKNFPGAKRASKFEIMVAQTKTWGPVSYIFAYKVWAK